MAKYGHTPFDSRTDLGYGRLSQKPGPNSQTVQASSLYPYAEDSTLLSDLEDEPVDDDDVEFANKFSNKLGLGKSDSDHMAIKMNVRDKNTFISPRLALASWKIFVGDVINERIYTTAVSRWQSPRVSGSTRGWSSPPRGEQWDDYENEWRFEDIVNDDEDDEYLSRVT